MELWAHQALEAAQEHGWLEVQAAARLKLSAAHRLRGQLSEAWKEAQRAARIAEQLESPSLARRVTYEKIQVTARMGLLQDSLRLSEAYLAATLAGPPEGASVDADICRLNIACCELSLGGRPEVLLQRPGGVLVRMGTPAALLACVADREDSEAEELLDVLEASPVTDSDFARYAGLAAERCPRPRRRARILSYAATQRRRLDGR